MSSGDKLRFLGGGLSLVPKRSVVAPTLVEVYISGSGQCFLVDEGELCMKRKINWRHNR